MQQVLLIGIAGGSASGKSTLAQNISNTFGDSVAILNHDSYYRAQDHLPLEERVKTNYDHPDAFETDLLLSHLQQLKAGHSVDVPVYDYTIHNRTKATQKILPRRVVILEGILIYSDSRITDMLDMKLYVDTEADIRLLRRIKRDVESRGRTLDSVIRQYEATVKPMHDAFVEPTKRLADLIFPGGGKNPAALSIIYAHIRSELSSISE